jgi:hypothetical protein
MNLDRLLLLNNLTVLIAAEQWTTTGTLEVAVIGRAFLTTLGRGDRTVDIKDDPPG